MLRAVLDACPALQRFAEEGRPGRTSHDKMVTEGVVQRAAAHPDLNRYSNIYPFDNTLAPCSVGYVNASLVSLNDSKYLIAAGPMHPLFYGPDTREAFFTSLIESNVRAMVCLARFARGFDGCADYLSDARFPSLEVNVGPVKLVQPGNFEVRSLWISTPTSREEVVHFYFPAWPNYDVPDDLGQVRELLGHVDASVRRGGIVGVHCSGGVGRSGSFIAALHGWRLVRDAPFNAENTDRVLIDAISGLRRQRHPWCVEHEEQAQCLRVLLREMLSR